MIACCAMLLAGCASVLEASSGSLESRGRVEAAVAAARTQPLPTGMVRVTVDRFAIDSRDREAWELILRTAGHERDGEAHGGAVLAGAMRSGDIDAVTASPMPASWRDQGLAWRAGDASLDLAGVLRVAAVSRYRREHQQQFLLLGPGSVGSIASVSQTVGITMIRLPGPQVVGTIHVIELRRTGSGFHVQLHHVAADRVALTLVPYVVTDEGRSVSISTLAADLFVEPGRQYVLMGDRAQSESFGRDLLSIRRDRVQTDSVLVLTVEVGTGDAGGRALREGSDGR